jgi:hypothetical protein
MSGRYDVKKSFSPSRRQILRGSVVGALAALVPGMLPQSKAGAADLPHVAEDDPVAVSLKYVNDATTSERPDESQFCHNCQYFKGSEATAWAACDIFPGKAVNSGGWCNVWTKKA